jgi:hypothetical protein
VPEGFESGEGDRRDQEEDGGAASLTASPFVRSIAKTKTAPLGRRFLLKRCS